MVTNKSKVKMHRSSKIWGSPTLSHADTHLLPKNKTRNSGCIPLQTPMSLQWGLQQNWRSVMIKTITTFCTERSHQLCSYCNGIIGFILEFYKPHNFKAWSVACYHFKNGRTLERRLSLSFWDQLRSRSSIATSEQSPLGWLFYIYWPQFPHCGII